MQNDITTLSFGAGVQSTTLAMLIINRDDRLVSVMGDDLPTDFIFADPGSESAATYEHADRVAALAEAAGIGFHKVSKGSLIEEILSGRKFTIPAFTVDDANEQGILRRQCTRDYKIEPIHKKIRELMNIGWRRHAKASARVWVGISVDEIQRMKPSRYHYETKVFPLIEMNWRRSDCLNYLREIGMSDVGKSSCIFCPYKSNREFLRMQTEEPEEWARVVEIDRQIRLVDLTEAGVKSTPYIHRSCVPIDEAELGQNQLDLVDMFDNECEGLCGV